MFIRSIFPNMFIRNKHIPNDLYPRKEPPRLPLLGDGRLDPVAHGFSISPAVTSKQVDSLLAKPAFLLRPSRPSSWAQE